MYTHFPRIYRRRMAGVLLLLLALCAAALPAAHANDGGLRLVPARLTLATQRIAGPAARFQVYLPQIAKPATTPTIARFSASPSTVRPGGASTLSWQVTGATSLHISPGIGRVTGSSVVVHPSTRTEYTLTATNAAGSVQQKTIVDVRSSNGSTDAGALWLPYTIAGNQVLPTYGVSVAVDNQGGIHAAYAIYAGTDNGNRPASYAYCPANCSSKASWTRVKLGVYMHDVRLELDPAGNPRMMLFGPIEDPNFPRSQYQYAECNGGCTSPANWQITTIATPIEVTATREYDNNHYFAIDRQGHMAFIYTDTMQNNHPGTFYISCAANCSNRASWVETTLSSAIFYKPSLAFSPNGQPRLAFGFWDQNEELNLGYAQCDSNCTDPGQWWGVGLTPVHGTAMYSLQADTAGRPRLAFFTGSYASAPFEANRLYYIWCNVSCVSQNADWSAASMGLPVLSGDGVDLALDNQNRPRVSYENAGQGLGYSWCDANCETGNPTWQTREVESKAALSNDYEVLPIRRCTISTWFNGQRTSLALDPAGNPRIGYDAQHWWYGTEIVNGVPHNCNYNDVTVARFALLGQP